ncbi:MAG: hypothetical protein PHI11_09820 [Gallionella sp.]|nr:hypothetical protein [Gallionella sp.]
MKTKIYNLLRLVISPLLVTCLFAFCVTPAYPAKPAETKITEQAAQPLTSTSAEVAELSKQVEELKAKEREHYTLIMESERKTIDWWFSFLGVITAVLAIGGAFIPWLMGRKDRELIELDKEKIKGMLGDATNIISKIQRHEIDAKQKVEEINTMKSFVSGQENSDPKNLNTIIASVQQDPTANPIDRLRAEAIAASEAEQADKAYALWNALTKLASDDANDHFNAGYWAQSLGTKLNGNELIYWMQQAGKHYQAVLAIKPDMPKVASNWASALMREATALNVNNAAEATVLCNRAEQILLQHADAAPQIVGYNLACVYGIRGDVATCLKWLKICQTHNVLPDCTHLQTDTDLDNVRSAPEFVAWLQTHCPDLPSA